MNRKRKSPWPSYQSNPIFALLEIVGEKDEKLVGIEIETLLLGFKKKKKKTIQTKKFIEKFSEHFKAQI